MSSRDRERKRRNQERSRHDKPAFIHHVVLSFGDEPPEMLPPCPDCGAICTASGRQRAWIPHEKTCPAALGVDEITEDDRVWFLENPGETERLRPMTAGEYLATIHTSPQLATQIVREHGHMLVTQLEPGVRIREPYLPLRAAISN